MTEFFLKLENVIITFGIQSKLIDWKKEVWKNKCDNEVSDFFWKCKTFVSQQFDFFSISPQQFFSISEVDNLVLNEIEEISSPQ